MKKLIAISVVFVLLASAAFAADVYFGAWGRGVFVPVKAFVDGNDADGNATYMGTEVQWADVPNFSLYFAIGGDNIGFVSNWDFAASDIGGQGRDGTLFTWWKPLDQFQLDIGWSRWDALRGPDIMESFSSYATAGDYPDFIFNRFATADWWTSRTPGAILRITPIENLFIGAAITTGPGGPITPWSGTLPKYSDKELNDKKLENVPAGETNNLSVVLRDSQYAFGYNIEGIGLVRAGYFGTSSTFSQLAQLAFKLTAVEGLFLDLGFGYTLDKGVADDKKNNMQIGLVANYIADAFGVIFGFQGVLGGDKDADDPVIGFALNPEFFLDFANIGLGFYMNATLAEEVETSMGFSAYVLKSVSGGSIKAGVAAAITPNEVDSKKNDILFQIPIEITYSIW